jgi:hypothetical protein
VHGKKKQHEASFLATYNKIVMYYQAKDAYRENT